MAFLNVLIKFQGNVVLVLWDILCVDSSLLPDSGSKGQEDWDSSFGDYRYSQQMSWKSGLDLFIYLFFNHTPKCQREIPTSCCQNQ